MAETPKFNVRNPAVKRIMQEIRELQNENSPDYKAEAIESNIFEWHFAIRGPPDTDFEGGIYHGRILLPSEYPFKPPEFILLTKNGRWETNTKICLSISSHHPEHWQPSWSVRTALLALIAFMPSPGNGAIGSLDFPKDERKRLAALSRKHPPSYGNPERQAVTLAVHEKILAAAAAASSPAKPEPQAKATSAEISTVKPSNAQIESQLPVHTGSSSTPGKANSGDVLVHSRSALGATGSAAGRPGTQIQQPFEGQTTRNFAPADVPSSSTANQSHDAVMQESSSWEERGLNFLAIALIVAIIALLGRKAFGGGTDIQDFA